MDSHGYTHIVLITDMNTTVLLNIYLIATCAKHFCLDFVSTPSGELARCADVTDWWRVEEAFFRRRPPGRVLFDVCRLTSSENSETHKRHV